MVCSALQPAIRGPVGRRLLLRAGCRRLLLQADCSRLQRVCRLQQVACSLQGVACSGQRVGVREVDQPQLRGGGVARVEDKEERGGDETPPRCAW